MALFKSLRPRQNRRHFADDIFKCICLNENEWISLKISLKFVLKIRINNIPALVQIMAWRRPGDKPLSEPMMVSLLTHICVTRPQWVKTNIHATIWIETSYHTTPCNLVVCKCDRAATINVGMWLKNIVPTTTINYLTFTFYTLWRNLENK